MFRQPATPITDPGDLAARFDPGNADPAEAYAQAVDAVTAASLGERAGVAIAPEALAAGPRDWFRPLYERCFPASARHAMGEYYTPRWLAQAVLADLPPAPGWRGLDPACGSGAFVVAMIAAVLDETRDLPPAARADAVLARVAGRDVNPLAVLTARANYALALAPLGRAVPRDALPVREGDALYIEGGGWERVVGNPPWVMWKDLPPAYREAAAAAGRASGLLAEGYAGGTDLNLCAMVAHAALERAVADGGHLAFLMPRQLLHLRAAAGLRRWRLADGTPLGLVGATDWTALRPFEAGCAPAAFVVRRGAPGPAIVPVRTWSGPRPAAEADWADVRPGLVAVDEAAVQVQGPEGPYLVDAPAALPALAALFGQSAYRGRRATETSPHGVFWLRPTGMRGGLVEAEHGVNPRARDGVAPGRVMLEPDRLFPLLRSGDVAAFAARPGGLLAIVPHDGASGAHALQPAAMPPRTLAYLASHRALLERRGSFREYRAGGPFYALWRVGPYTFAPWKVVWPEMGALRAAVVGTAPTPWGEAKGVLPEGKLNLVAFEAPAPAHYLCALLNAPGIRRAYERVSSQIGRPSRLPFAIAAYDAGRWSHRALAAASVAAHAGALEGDRRERLLGWLLARVTAWR